MARSYIIYCEPCGYKKPVPDPLNVGLVPYQKCSVQGRLPVYNKETKKTDTFDFVETMPKYKCPQCGRVVTLKKFNVPKTPDYTPAEEPKNEPGNQETNPAG